MIEDIEKYNTQQLEDEILDDTMSEIAEEMLEESDAIRNKEEELKDEFRKKEISKETNKINAKKLRAQKKYKLIRTAQDLVRPAAFILPAFVSVAITGGTFKLINVNPFVRENKLYEEHMTEDKDSLGTTYQTLDYVQYGHRKDKGYSDKADISFDVYSPWIAEEDYYKRTVTNYSLESTVDFKKFIGKHIEDITVDDIKACNFVDNGTKEQLGFNLNSDQIAADGYINMHSEYINKLVKMKQTKNDNNMELGFAFAELWVMYFISLGVISFIDFCKHNEKKKGIKDILENKELKINKLLSEYSQQLRELQQEYDRLNHKNKPNEEDPAYTELCKILNEDEEEQKDAITK